jgi:hypothetical protein
MKVTVLAVTESVVEDVTAPNEALIVAVPAATPVATGPFIEATEVLDETQTTCVLRSCTVPSLKVPVALNRLVEATWINGLTGVIVIDCSVAVVTFNEAAPEMEPEDTVIVTVPCALQPTMPPLRGAAMDVSEDVHVSWLELIFAVLPSS